MYLIKNLKMAVRETTGVPVHNDTEVNNMSFVLKGCQRRNSCLVQLASSWNCEETLSEVHVHRCAYLYQELIICRGEYLTPYSPVLYDCAEVKRLPFRVT